MSPRISIAPDTLHNSLGGETVLLNLGSGEAFTLDATGQQIWRLIQDLGDRDAVVEQLAADFDATEEHIRDDLDEFLSQLSAKGLIKLES